MKRFGRYRNTQDRNPSKLVSRGQSIKLIETSYLTSATALIWIALYYLPVGGAFFRLVLPLPLALLQVRRGASTGWEGLSLLIMLLVVLMGPVRGPLVLFPYGFLSVWLGWSWSKNYSWWLSWCVGVFIGTIGFLIRVFLLSILVGENLWIVITRAGYILLERLIDWFNIALIPDLNLIQFVALGLVVMQEFIFVLTLHVVAFWVFPRLSASIPNPPRLLNGIVGWEST
ncbi:MULTISPECIES: DUF2232 domain-containing protein [Prochlorococcus]|uniref:DUF2232 domain-containing protein n=1 Tax=Prochlorococcus TaxID=1218 RepID=UPI0005339EB8|nr:MULTISPECIES: DUF2232 domain-containing protein [Prochlorococcus]KGG12958.1 hypothetical protein EV05_0631 [Prochlorococcus sp. MIT 0601]